MKSFVFAAASLLLVTGSAFAADQVVVQEDLGGYNWSGVYVGGAVGYAWIDAEDLSFGEGEVDDDGFSGAVYAGYNFQHLNWVFGVEGDVKFKDAEVFDDGNFMLPLEARVEGSLRGRVGYAVDRFLPYLTGGLAVGRYRIDHEGDDNPDDFADETITGFVVGGGVEWAATENIIVRGEYLFTDYGTETFDFYDGTDPHEVSVETHDIRIGVAYKF